MKSNSYKNASLGRDQLFAMVPGLAVMETLFDGVNDHLFCIKNGERQYVSVNQAFVAISRRSKRAALLGRTAREVFPPLLAAGYEQQDDALFANGIGFSGRLEMITNADGGAGWYLTQKQPVHDRRGRMVAIACVSTDLDAVASDNNDFAKVADVIERIRRDYGKPLRIESLARTAAMSVSQLERNMRTTVRISPRQLLTRTRVDAAARMLRNTNDMVSVIAAACGFYDQAQLSRQFRAVTGLTPRQYRRALGADALMIAAG